LVYAHEGELIVPKDRAQVADVEDLAALIANQRPTAAAATNRRGGGARDTLERDVKLNLQIEFDRLIRKTVSLLISEDRLTPGRVGIAEAGMIS
jgi:hypothetical protein